MRGSASDYIENWNAPFLTINPRSLRAALTRLKASEEAGSPSVYLFRDVEAWQRGWQKKHGVTFKVWPPVFDRESLRAWLAAAKP